MKLVARILPLIVLLAMFAPALAQQQTIHTVQSGETLFRIAVKYGVGMDAIAQANGIVDKTRIFAGQQLVIPDFNAEAPVVENPMVASAPAYHTIQPGETLASIAKLYGLTPQQLAQANNIANPNLIYRGKQLLVWTNTATDIPATTEASAPSSVENAAPPAETAPEITAPTLTTYIIQPGEHLAQIARRFNVSWSAIAQANGILNADQIYAGQTIIIPPAETTVNDLGILSAPAQPSAPMPTQFVGKQILVDLSDQRIYAYENGALLRDVLVSTGLPGTPTVQGDYSIYVKHVAQTMTGPGYYLPDVPYVMYFFSGYGIHGTYWHNNFGQPMSHGCVNLPTPEAEWFFNWAEVGTPVHVQV